MTGVTASGVVVVTGTGTAVGKTVATASVAAVAMARGQRVAVVKPAQTGVFPGEPGDADEVVRLSGLAGSDAFELARFPDPLAPATAARVAGMAPVDLEACADRIRALVQTYDLVLVEGAGGLLVRYDGDATRGDGSTIASLAAALGAPLVVVTHPGLGTLNHTELTLEAMDRRGLALAGLLLGSWPAEPDLACRLNIADLESVSGRPLSGALAEGMATLSPADFLAAARAGLGPELGGRFDAADFRRTYAVPSRPAGSGRATKEQT